MAGHQAHGSGFWSFTADLVNGTAAAWQAPSLVTSLEPGWDDELDDRGCAAIRRSLQRWLD